LYLIGREVAFEDGTMDGNFSKGGRRAKMAGVQVCTTYAGGVIFSGRSSRTEISGANLSFFVNNLPATPNGNQPAGRKDA
jgi:hypothetical protein